MTFTEVRTDPLTGVNNRRGMADSIAGQFAMMHRYGTTFTLTIFDIDHFKTVNDEKGHLRGDQILQDLARLLDEFVRETDVVARYGGEEFVIVMPQTELEGACRFAQRSRMKVETELSITISGGVAQAVEGDTQETLLARAIPPCTKPRRPAAIASSSTTASGWAPSRPRQPPRPRWSPRKRPRRVVSQAKWYSMIRWVPLLACPAVLRGVVLRHCWTSQQWHRTCKYQTSILRQPRKPSEHGLAAAAFAPRAAYAAGHVAP